jgi:hypothetical protein
MEDKKLGLNFENIRDSVCKILDSFDSLRKILAERYECSSEKIVILDEPLRIEIERERIRFWIDEEEHGILGRDYIHLSEEVEFEAISWIEGLSSLKFKRYSLRKNK